VLNNAPSYLPFHFAFAEPFLDPRRLTKPGWGNAGDNGDTHMGASILIGILITFLVVILVLYLVQRLPLDARARQIAQIIVIIIGIISLLKYLAVF